MQLETQNDPVIDLVQAIARQGKEADMTAVIEGFSDDLLMAQMELVRARKAQRSGTEFTPREKMFAKAPMAHPADAIAPRA